MALERLELSPANASVEFTGTKVIGGHDGVFRSFTGEVRHDGKDPTNARVRVLVQMSSVETDSPKLDEHLKSGDFFDVSVYPDAVFETVSIIRQSENRHTVTAHLSIRNVKMVVRFDADIVLRDDRVIMNAEFPIRRKAFGIVYPGMPDNLIRDEVMIRISVDSPLK